MSEYTPPLREIRFVLDEIADIDGLIAQPGYEHVDEETVVGALDEAGRFMSEQVAPTNRIGDQVGSVFVDGAVRTPDVFKPVWEQYVAAGWNAVSGPVEYGGHGFPQTVAFAIKELFVTSNMAFSLCPMLTGSVINLLRYHGNDDLRATYLENLVTARWTGTMVLTEPEAGTDVGALRTKAEPGDDGTWRITGTKTFITWGDHDLAENIIHLVLARSPGAPPGTKGLSLFVVPKFLVDAGGSLGTRNAIETVSLEHKLGIHASPTAVLSFDGAVGYLVGEPNEGMRLMFAMMNQARLEVGLEGLAVGERAYQLALAFAQDRIQGRVVGATSHEPAAIIEHPDVRRMLLTMKAYNEAIRGLLYDAIAANDRTHHPDEEVRSAAADRIALLTPIAKAWSSDVSIEVASLGVQVHGGMGFIEETGAAQHFRDSRITPIYEGTNGVQAIDLVMRKLPLRGGAVVRSYLDEIAGAGADLTAAGLDDLWSPLLETLASVREATEWLLDADDPNDRLAGATPYLAMLGALAGGYYLAREAVAAAAHPGDPWMEAKINTARFYLSQLLPGFGGKLAATKAGAGQLYAVALDELEPAG